MYSTVYFTTPSHVHSPVYMISYAPCTVLYSRPSHGHSPVNAIRCDSSMFIGNRQKISLKKVFGNKKF